MTYTEFRDKNMGKYLDFDGEYGCQCWDLAQFYFRDVLGLPRYILDGCDLVSNMLIPPKREVLDQYFDEVPMNKMQQGDVVIWNWGHIAVYDHYENGECYYFSQNPGACHIEMIKADGGYAFRKKTTHRIAYRVHIENMGWSNWVYDGQTAGTTGKGLKIEALQIDYDVPTTAKAHIQDKGWIEYGKNDESTNVKYIDKDTVIGTTGENKRLECLCLGSKVKYRVHLQDTGWTCWTDADGICTLGSVGQGLRIEAIEIKEN